MACPQCGGALATYSLGERDASVCEDCGYVGIAADHKGEPIVVESWNDALRRFYAEHGQDEDPRIEVAREDVAARRREGESWEDALGRFYAEHGGDDGDDASEEPVDDSEATDGDDASEEPGDDSETDDANGKADETAESEAVEVATDETAESEAVEVATDETAEETPASQSSAGGS